MNDGMKRNPPSEKIRLRDEARYLRKRIKQAQDLLKKREEVKLLTDRLTDLQYQIKNGGQGYR